MIDDSFEDEILGSGSDDEILDEGGIKAFAIVSKSDLKDTIDATSTRGLRLSSCTHDRFDTASIMTGADVIFVECRVVEGLEDLQMVREIRQKRPLVPIITISTNDSKEFIIETFKSGATDFVSATVEPEVLAEKTVSLFELAKAAGLVELQNQELVHSMKELRKSNADLKREMEDRKKAEVERTKAQEQLGEAAKMATLGEMAGGIAHEIKTPLAIVIGNSSMLVDMLAEENPDLADCRDMTEEVVRVSERISSIIKGLKSVSRGAEQDPFEKITVKEVVDDTLSFCTDIIEREGIKLEVDDFPETLEIECQPTQVSQVILNLLTNARHALEELDEKWIKVNIEDKGDFAEITITDSGSGIPKDLYEKILEPFFTTKPRGKGTGLGLSISKKIVAGHGGELILNHDHPNTRFVFNIHKSAPPQEAEKT